MLYFKSQKQPFADNYKIGALEDFAIFTGNYLRWSLFLRKGVKVFNFIKNRLQNSCFSVNIAKFLKIAFL